MLTVHRWLIRSQPHAYALHQAVWDCFPGNDDARFNGDTPFLYRHEPRHDQDDRCAVIVQSKLAPDSSKVQEAAPSRELNVDGFRDGMEFTFALRASPKRHAPKSDGPRESYPAWCRQWLQRRGEEAGAKFADVSVCVEERVFLTRHSATLDNVSFSGRLFVLDAQRFRDAYVRGIGPKRSFGFGLLMLR